MISNLEVQKNQAYKETKAGLFPSDWNCQKVQESNISVIDGDRGKEYPNRTDLYEDEYCLFLSAKNVTKEGLQFEECIFINKEKDQKLGKGKLKRNDIVITTRGTVGNFGYYSNSVPYKNIRINSGMAIFRVKDNDIDTNYLYQLLRSFVLKNQIRRVIFGSAQPQLTIRLINDFLIPLPPLTEQLRIANILNTWDKAIALTEKLIAALQQRKKGLMQRLMTGEVRFPGYEDDWKVDHLGKFANVKRGASPRPIKDPRYFSEVGRGWIRIADVTNSPTRYLNHTKQYLSALGETKSVQVEVGDLIMSICATIGVPKIVNIPACIHDGFVVLSDYHDTLNIEFLYHYINFITGSLVNRGQPGTQKNLNTGLVKNIRVPYISLDEQKKIAEILNLADNEIELRTQIVEILNTQKKGLMQRLLTGKIHVSID